ncbi:MAG TPA: DUF262 domain-containing protein [Verrucomicrobiae bacterium]|jgi:uncharacterized protein with ParB-like and HNH nuclease domain|nr:DUF262 domain-containing protein [Verrucomicrobiae bacterium]
MKISKLSKQKSEHVAEVIDEAENDDTTPNVRYEITSYGADYDVAGFVARLQRDDIVIPPFQRDYVWRLPEASRFVESILLGLPVPGVFLAKEVESSKLLVIDGQQRLKTLQFFVEGIFNPKEGDKNQKVFKLSKVSERFEGLTYKALSDAQRRNLNDYVIHATIIKQEKPTNDDTSIYHIFERLNTTGQRLSAQEIRVAVYRGALLDLIEELNEIREWRQVFGKPHPRLKDRELILRFFALYANADSYERPLAEFLSKFALKNRNPTAEELKLFRETFISTIKLIFEILGAEAFRPERALNAAVFDSVMIGLAKRLSRGKIAQTDQIKASYKKLTTNPEYLSAVTDATSDKPNVEKRIKLATAAFSHIK